MSEIKLTVTIDGVPPADAARFVQESLDLIAQGSVTWGCGFVDRNTGNSGLLRRTRKGVERYTLHIRREVEK